MNLTGPVPRPAADHVTRDAGILGTDFIDTEARPDMKRMRAYRLGRVREQLRTHDLAGIVLFDPINIRYATGSRNMSVWTLHNAARYCFIATEGPVVLFEYGNAFHLADGIETIDELRPAVSWFYFGAGAECENRARKWGAEIAELVRVHGGGNMRLAADHCDFMGVDALRSHGVVMVEGQRPMEDAREIKSADEVECMRSAIAACEAGMARMHDALRGGMTENELWAILHSTNIELGGEWIETRLLSSGPRTNPWWRESCDRVIRPGELVSYDTDLIGTFGYCADISRSVFCGPGRPADEQCRLYRMAWDQIHHNVDLVKPGLGFREFAERAWPIPERFAPRRYSSLAHGVGMADEHPGIAFADVFETKGNEGPFRPGMTVCIESYMGEVGGYEGVKLEQQVLVTGTGCELLSTFPFEENLLFREV